MHTRLVVDVKPTLARLVALARTAGYSGPSAFPVLDAWDEHVRMADAKWPALSLEERRMAFRSSARLRRLPSALEELVPSGLAPESDVAWWVLKCVSEKYEYQVLPGLFEIQMARVLLRRLGSRLKLLDLPSVPPHGKRTDFWIEGSRSIELKALQGANPKGALDNAERANAQHQAVRAERGGGLGVTLVGLAKEGLDDDSRQYIVEASEGIYDNIWFMEDTGAIFFVVEEFADRVTYWENETRAALFTRAGASNAVLPRGVRSWCPEPVRCPRPTASHAADVDPR